MRAVLLILVPSIALGGLLVACDDGGPVAPDAPWPADARLGDLRLGGDSAPWPDVGVGLADQAVTITPDTAMVDTTVADQGGQSDAASCGPNGTPCELDHDSCTNDECQGGQCVTLSVAINGLACSVAGQAGTCLFSVCCTGCVASSPKGCATGDLDTACGAAGSSCVDCTATAASHCCAGVCQASPCP